MKKSKILDSLRNVENMAQSIIHTRFHESKNRPRPLTRSLRLQYNSFQTFDHHATRHVHNSFFFFFFLRAVERTKEKKERSDSPSGVKFKLAGWAKAFDTERSTNECKSLSTRSTGRPTLLSCGSFDNTGCLFILYRQPSNTFDSIRVECQTN